MRAERAEDRGIARALNQASALARGRYLARMDADDVCLPGRLAVQARYLDQHPEIGVLGSQAIVVDTKGHAYGRQRVPVGADRVRAALETSSPLIHPTVMMRREALLRVGGYRKLFDAAEDYELWLRLASIVELDNLPNSLLLYRRHPGSTTAWQPLRQARRAALAVVAYRLRADHGVDPLADMTRISHWRQAFRAVDPAAVDEVRYMTAGFLADNGGTLVPSGRRYFRLACRSVRRLTDRRLRMRLALACVRHELQLLRNERRLEAALTAVTDLASWPAEMVRAYAAHGSILWRAKRKAHGPLLRSVLSYRPRTRPKRLLRSTSGS